MMATIASTLANETSEGGKTREDISVGSFRGTLRTEWLLDKPALILNETVLPLTRNEFINIYVRRLFR